METHCQAVDTDLPLVKEMAMAMDLASLFLPFQSRQAPVVIPLERVRPIYQQDFLAALLLAQLVHLERLRPTEITPRA